VKQLLEELLVKLINESPDSGIFSIDSTTGKVQVDQGKLKNFIQQHFAARAVAVAA
jgi:hypothetical protein